MHAEYDDEYATCVETYATLRIFGEAVEPESVSSMLGMTPTRLQRKGLPLHEGSRTITKLSGWFLETRGNVQSRDSRRHIDWLLDALTSKITRVQELQARGMEFDICCYWVSVGQGGPTIGPEQSRLLGSLGIELWFDIYFHGSAGA
jgi:hypothetical protein